MYTLTYITSNPEKVNEAKEILPGLVWQKMHLAEIQSLDSEEIITAKMMQAVAEFPDADERVLVVEDVSLNFHNCQGLPGPLVKWFLKTIGADGLYTMAKAFNAYGASVVLTVGVKAPGGKPMFFKGEVEGNIVPPRGKAEKHFGFDPIFAPKGMSKTYGEMTPEEKNAVSHRGLALRKVREYLENKLSWQFQAS